MTKDGTLYVATGSNQEGWDGNGVWYTTDKGLTWNKIPGTSNCTEVESGNASDYVWMATSSGLKKWKLGDASLTSVTVASGNPLALKVSGDEEVIVTSYGSNKTYVSENGGASFTDKSGTAANNLVPSGAQRMEYAISHERNAQGKYTIYAVRTNSNLLGMHVSQDNGTTWTEFVGNPGTPAPSDFDIYRDQGTYNSIASVSPNDPEMLLIGGIDVWRWKQTVNNPPSGGFRKVSQWFVDPSSSIYVHADNHMGNVLLNLDYTPALSEKSGKVLLIDFGDTIQIPFYSKMFIPSDITIPKNYKAIFDFIVKTTQSTGSSACKWLNEPQYNVKYEDIADYIRDYNTRNMLIKSAIEKNAYANRYIQKFLKNDTFSNFVKIRWNKVAPKCKKSGCLWSGGRFSKRKMKKTRTNKTRKLC
jgi:hypothetical protein